MEATQSYPNLLSEKQAAKRLGVARITLLRAREAGRIRFFRIGTRVLYCAEQLSEFLESCERNAWKVDREGRRPEHHAEIMTNKQVSSLQTEVSRRKRPNSEFTSKESKANQASLPFSAAR